MMDGWNSGVRFTFPQCYSNWFACKTNLEVHCSVAVIFLHVKLKWYYITQTVFGCRFL
uniref:Uncharacterized protein n=1 Tax=Anguilla anguilla TaxID=7936 RepID=A0A0E9XVW7_ANGAN